MINSSNHRITLPNICQIRESLDIKVQHRSDKNMFINGSTCQIFIPNPSINHRLIGLDQANPNQNSAH